MKKMIMNNVVLGKIVTGLLLVCGLIVAPVASATCYSSESSTTDSGNLSVVDFDWGGSAAIDFGDVEVSPNAQVGDVIATVAYGRLDGLSTLSSMLACSTTSDFSGTVYLGSSSLGTVTYNGGEYIDIGIDGLALQMENVGTDPAGSQWAFPPDASMSESDMYITVNTGGPYALRAPQFGNWTFNLVKVADTVSEGISNSGTIATFSLSNPDTFDLSSSTIYSFTLSAITVTAPTCTVDSYDTSVDLGTASSQSFTTVGSTTNSTDFSINMTCSSTSLSPTLTFSGTADDNVSSVFANDSGTATGVGVQLLYGDTVITPDTAVSLGAATSTSATDYDFKARLYQTTSAVTAGSVDTTVNFTLEYE